MKKSIFIALAMSFLLNSPAKAGIIIGISGFTGGAIANNQENYDAEFYATLGMPIGSVMAITGVVMMIANTKFVNLANILIILDETNDFNAIEKSLVKNFPEINDMSIISDLANEVRFGLTNAKDLTENFKLVQIDELLVQDILDRSDLSAFQVKMIVEKLK